MVNDKKEGLAREFYTDGKVLSEGSFAGGKRQGIFKTFDQQGRLVAEEEYKNDNISYHREYNPDGKLRSEKIYYFNPS